jgi:hypothetical protein
MRTFFEMHHCRRRSATSPIEVIAAGVFLFPTEPSPELQFPRTLVQAGPGKIDGIKFLKIWKDVIWIQ